MPAFNFKAQFAEMVESGKKRQTIRPQRKRRPAPGDVLFLYTGMRTKACHLLKQTACKSVHYVLISQLFVEVDSCKLSDAEVEELAIADGFDSTESFRQFFQQQYGLPVVADLIKW